MAAVANLHSTSSAGALGGSAISTMCGESWEKHFQDWSSKADCVSQPLMLLSHRKRHPENRRNTLVCPRRVCGASFIFGPERPKGSEECFLGGGHGSNTNQSNHWWIVKRSVTHWRSIFLSPRRNAPDLIYPLSNALIDAFPTSLIPLLHRCPLDCLRNGSGMKSN